MEFSKLAMMDVADEREKREKKALSAECTPLSLDKEKQSGIFKGSSGSYITTLEFCTCKDNARRRFPCKHMYRLAAELGIYNIGTLQSDVSKVKKTKYEKNALFEKAISLIDSYPEEVQRDIRLALYFWHNQKSHIITKALMSIPLSDELFIIVNDPIAILKANTQKRTVEGMLNAGFAFPKELKPTKKARYEWCLEHPDVVCSIAYADTVAVSISDLYKPVALKVYTYLNKKFNPEDYEGGEDIVITIKA